MIKYILQVAIILLIVLCEKQVSKKNNSENGFMVAKDEVDNLKNALVLTDSTQNDSIEINITKVSLIDSVQEYTIEIDSSLIKNYEYNIKDFVLNGVAIFKYNNKNNYISIPFILNHQDVYYTENDYPDELELRSIPNSIDTLIVVSGESDCYNCLNLLKIQSSDEKELFYRYTINEDNTVLVQGGDLDTILSTRNLAIEDLNNSKYIVSNYNNWKNYSDLSGYLENEYITSVNLKYHYLPDVSQANEKVERKLIKKFKEGLYPIDIMKLYYQNILEKEGGITIDNLLSSEGSQKYLHSGGINKNESLPNVLLLVDSIKIFYISYTNKIYTINYLKNRTEYLTDNNAPLDDNNVDVIDNTYKINDWDSKNMINLFHEDMVEGEYIVIYQLKPKYIDTYIYSPIEIITYEKPK